MGKLSDRLRDRLFSLIIRGEQARVAELAGMSASTLSRWHTGAEPLNPTLETVERLANALDVDPDELLAPARPSTASEPHIPYGERPPELEIVIRLKGTSIESTNIRQVDDRDLRDEPP